ncbi:MAG: transposase [Symbiobacteriia bacterium]
MLGRRTNQFSFADVDEWWRKIPATSRWTQIRGWSQRHWQDEVFALWYADTGRPSIPPSYMVTLLLLELAYGWSDRQAVENALFDDRVKFALGVSRSPEITCDHSTLCKFRAQAMAQGAGRQVLQQTLTEASAAGLLGDEGDLIDSFMIAGAAARQGTLMLMARAIRRVLVEAEEAGLVAPALRRADYRGRRKPAIDWASEAARHELLQELVADAGTLVAWGQQAGQPESLRQAAELLAVVVAQDITRDEDGTAQIAQWLRTG